MSINSWTIKNSSNHNVVYQSNTVSSAIDDEATGEFVYTLPFSDFTETGNFYIEVEGIGRSYDFEISKTVYNDVFEIIMKGLYFQRSGRE